MSFPSRSRVKTRPLAKVAPEAAALPPLNEHGFLPQGIYDTSLRELEMRFATTPARKICWQRLLTFLREVRGEAFSHIYLGGGFISSASSPGDIDVVLQTRSEFGPEAFKAMEPLFAQGLEAIYRRYHVHLHFWCEGFPADIHDFRDFFQNIRPGLAFPIEYPDETKRGIVRITLPRGSRPVGP
jgi:hypothetical protein